MIGTWRDLARELPSEAIVGEGTLQQSSHGLRSIEEVPEQNRQHEPYPQDSYKDVWYCGLIILTLILVVEIVGSFLYTAAFHSSFFYFVVAFMTYPLYMLAALLCYTTFFICAKSLGPVVANMFSSHSRTGRCFRSKHLQYLPHLFVLLFSTGGLAWICGVYYGPLRINNLPSTLSTVH